MYNLDHNIKFKRNKKYFLYTYNGAQHKFYPDFIVDGIYVEIKGFFTEQVKEKIKQFPTEEKLIMLFENDLQDIFSYVHNKYSKNFIGLYDGNPHQIKVK